MARRARSLEMLAPGDDREDLAGPFSPETRRKVRRVLAVASAISVLLVVVVFVLVLRMEMAHDESRCPFHDRGARDIAPGVRIVEQARRCMSDVEEHRWLVSRRGGARKEIGRRRMEPRFFAAGGYRWEASEDDRRKIVVRVAARGFRTAVYREDEQSRDFPLVREPR